jgi:hypothetical protein
MICFNSFCISVSVETFKAFRQEASDHLPIVTFEVTLSRVLTRLIAGNMPLMLFLALHIGLLTTPGNTIQLYRNTALPAQDFYQDHYPVFTLVHLVDAGQPGKGAIDNLHAITLLE